MRYKKKPVEIEAEVFQWGMEEFARLEAELETLKKDNEWISVEDRLPDNAELCIVIAAGHHELAAYGLSYKCWIQEINNKDGEGDFTIRLDYVTHWRPLPQPPKQN